MRRLNGLSEKELLDKIEELQVENESLKERLQQKSEVVLDECSPPIKSIIQDLKLANCKMQSAENLAALGHWYFFSDTNEFEAHEILTLILNVKDTTKYRLDRYLELVHPDDRELLLNRIMNPIISDDHLEHRIILNGKIKYLYTKIIAIHKQDGRTVLEGYVQDMTHLVEKLHEVENFKYAVNNAVEEICSCKLDGTLFFANQLFIENRKLESEVSNYKLFGINSFLACKEDWDSLLDSIRCNGGSKKLNRVEETLGGIIRTLEIVTYIVRVHNQEEVVWFFLRDISLRETKEIQLKELNSLLEAILNSIPVYLFVKDPSDEFRYRYWNKAFAEHAHIPASMVLGRTDMEVFPNATNAEKFRRDDLELLEGGKTLQFQENYTTAEGEVRVVNTIKTLAHTGKETPLIIGISWDITEMKKTEKELIDARLKAEQSDKLKSAFLANMSHEIRTPLNAIVGFSKLITSSDEGSKELYSEIIDDNAELLLQLINDILDLSKIEAGTLEFNSRPVELKELFNDIYFTHHKRVHSGVAFVIDEDLDRILVNVDPSRLLQVITNLITNAIKFTTEGEIRFGYRLNGDQVEVSVSDTGIGMPEDKVESVFKRFIKLNTFAQGTGLGLSICKMIVERMGGKIWLESKEGVGSTFYFTIPYEAEADKIDSTSWIVPNNNLMNITPNYMKTILVAEDIDSNFLLLKALIGKKYTLIRANNGLEAVELFKTSNPDLILMDIKMPMMNGLEATKIIRELSMDIPIIALTAFAFENDRKEAMAIGMTDFLTKPIASALLQEKLLLYLKE